MVYSSDNFLLPAISLAQRELVRFLRQRSRIIGALVTPIFFWVAIGLGMGHSFHAGGAPGASGAPAADGGFIAYFYPGTILMILLFTAIFSTISIIEDRREGFLQSVLVAPIPRMAIVLGKTLGGTILATGQGIVFLLLAPMVHIHFTVGSAMLAVAIMLIVSFALTALGICIAWRMSSTQGFHAIMNLFLMPMWFLSGALFPAQNVMFRPLKWVMAVNPLSYGLAALTRALYWGSSIGATSPGFGISLIVSIAFAVVMFVVAGAIARGGVSADLQ